MRLKAPLIMLWPSLKDRDRDQKRGIPIKKRNNVSGK